MYYSTMCINVYEMIKNRPLVRRCLQTQRELLDVQQVYYKAEVEEFRRVFYKPRINPTPADPAKMNACIDPAVNSWSGLD